MVVVVVEAVLYALPPDRAKSFTCKYLENRSGGTRTRTGDTMIFSQFPSTATNHR